MTILSILTLIFSPLIIALIILSPIFPNNKIKIRRFSKTFSIIHFIYSSLFLVFFNSTHLGWSYQKELTFFGSSWLKSLGITASFAMDGISLVFVLLTSFISMLVLIASKTTIRRKHRLFYPLVLILESILLGLFCTKDMFVFFFFLQAELIVSYLLISQWKDKNDATAGKKYITYNSICNFILFLGMIILYFYSFVQTGILTADIESLNISDGFFALGFNSFIFWCIFIGFACKLMIVPIHYGIINAQINSATPVSMLINGLILNIGGYGLIRFNIGVFSELYGFFAYILMILGVINIIYGACIAFSQTNIKKIITYLNLTQTGFILIGLSSLTDIGFEGALFHMISRSLIWTGLFMLIGSIYQRTKTLNIDLLGGLNKIIPICYNLGLIICLGALSIPFTSNFISEFMILNGLILNDEMPEVLFLSILTICLIGLIFVSGSILLFFNKTFYGETMSQFNQLKGKRNITKSEIIVFSLIALSIIFLGIFPNAILEIFDMTSDVIIDFLKV